MVLHEALWDAFMQGLKDFWGFSILAGAPEAALDFQFGQFRTVTKGMILAANVLLDSYTNVSEFMSDWKWLRLLVPLQVRLFVEQILWDRGGRWRQLVTGFRPVSTSGPRRP